MSSRQFWLLLFANWRFNNIYLTQQNEIPAKNGAAKLKTRILIPYYTTSSQRSVW